MFDGKLVVGVRLNVMFTCLDLENRIIARDDSNYTPVWSKVMRCIETCVMFFFFFFREKYTAVLSTNLCVCSANLREKIESRQQAINMKFRAEL